MSQSNPAVRRVPLGSICELINGRTFKPSEWTETGLPIVRIQNLNNLEAKFNFYDGEVQEKFLIDSGALLFAWSGTPGTSFGTHIWNGGAGILNQHIFKIIFDERIVDKQYLRFAINQKLEELIGQAHGGVGLQHVTKGIVERTQIYLPPLDKQRQIVDVLSRTEGLVCLRREAQAKVAEIIPALFLDMFGDPTNNPKGWQVVALGSLLSSIDSGRSPKCHDRPREGNEWGVLRLGAVTRSEYAEDQHKTLPPEITADPAIEVRPGDLLLSRKNTSDLVGASAYVWNTGGRILLPDLIFRLRIRDAASVDAIYLWKLLTSQAKRRALSRIATGSAGSMPNISKERLRTLPIELPPYALQARFREYVRLLRSISVQQTEALKRAEATFQASLARAFSGNLSAAAAVEEAAVP